MQSITLPAIHIPDHVTETKLGRVVVPGVTVPDRMVVIDPAQIKKLIDAARLATETAYNNVPSIKFPVGAAVIMADDADGEIFTAANCENSVLNAGICAERALLHYVVAKGFRRIKYLAVTTPNRKKDINLRSPCGLCRQTIAEFADDNTLVFIDHDETGTLADVVDMARLLPYAYRLAL
jgi:cytidine deaminase